MILSYFLLLLLLLSQESQSSSSPVSHIEIIKIFNTNPTTHSLYTFQLAMNEWKAQPNGECIGQIIVCTALWVVDFSAI